MSGIWDRIVPGTDRLSAHLVKAAIFCGADATTGFSDAQILAGLNSKLVTPLDANAQTDLGTIRTAITNAATAQAKLIILERFDALNIAVENGVLTSESVYRTKMGI